MDFKTQGDEIVRRKQAAFNGFQKTFQLGKMYTEKEMQLKNDWCSKISEANEDWRKWLKSIPKVKYS